MKGKMLDERQKAFLVNFMDRDSETFSDAYNSAIKAGYEKTYAENITGQLPRWLSESMKDEKMLTKAEQNLSEFLEDEDGKIRADITKFVTSRLNKKKWSERTEHTGEGGESIKHIIEFKGNE